MNNHRWKVDPRKQIRVVIDSDAACEGDDQFAIVHALCTPKCEVVGIIAEHFGSSRGGESMQMSYEEICKILHLTGCQDIPVFHGAQKELSSADHAPRTEASEFLVKECRRDDPRPLFILCQGALSTVATALLTDPETMQNALCITVGGCNYPHGGFEFNYGNDLLAADLVMRSRMKVWQIPEEVYSTMQIGLMELVSRVGVCGSIGRYLVEHLFEVQEPLLQLIPRSPQADPHTYALDFPNGESWSLGDSCGIGLLLAANAGTFQVCPAPVISAGGVYRQDNNRRQIRIYRSINCRFILEDFISRLQYYFT